MWNLSEQANAVAQITSESDPIAWITGNWPQTVAKVPTGLVKRFCGMGAAYSDSFGSKRERERDATETSFSDFETTLACYFQELGFLLYGMFQTDWQT